MTPPWFYPNNISQHAEHETHVSWNGESNGFFPLKNPDGNFLSTTKELLHIANATVNDLKMKTYYLYLCDFRIVNVPDVISGIEVEINARRGGRITDDTISLMYNGEFIGENKADFILDPVKVYGSITDTWSIKNLTPDMITDPLFGIGVRFQSHPSWPHRESPKLDYIRIRVW